MEEKNQTKEDFCPICVAAVPLAFGVSTVSNSNSVQEEETNIIIEEEEEKQIIEKKGGRSNSNNLIKWLSIFLLFAGLISLILILN